MSNSNAGPFDDDPYEEEQGSNLSEYHERQMAGSQRSVMDDPGVQKRGSPINSEMQFRTDSLSKYGIAKIFTSNARFLKLLFGSLFAFGIIYLFLLMLSSQTDGNEVVDRATIIMETLYRLALFFVVIIWNVLFVYPVTWIAIWVFIAGRLFYGWVLSRAHDVFVVMWLDGYKHLRIVMFPRYIDEIGNPYLGGKASLFYRLINGGNPRIPFHEDMFAPFMDFLQVSVEEVSDGVGATTVYNGSGVILFTDPSNDIDDNLEAQDIFQYIDVPSENEGFVYRYCTLDLDRILPVNIWQSILSGMDLKYWQKYSDERKKNQLLERELNFTIYDSGLKYHSEYYPSQEALAQQYRGMELLDPDEYRNWDDIGKQIRYHTKGS